MSESKITESLKKFYNSSQSKIKIITIIGLVGILLIFFSDTFSGNKSTQDDTAKDYNYAEYTKNLEIELEELISSIDGVGACKVMITLENTAESVYATDTETKNDEKSVNEKDEYVIYDSDKGEAPVLIKEYFPRVQGVTVVCGGGDSIAVKEKIIESVTSLFNIPANRVSVSKIKA